MKLSIPGESTSERAEQKCISKRHKKALARAALEVLGCMVSTRSGMAMPGRVDENVDAVEADEGAVDGVPHVGAAGNVGSEWESLTTGGGDLVGESFKQGFAPRHQGDLCAHLREGQREVAADTAGGASN
jgi:hypothetical protein